MGRDVIPTMTVAFRAFFIWNRRERSRNLFFLFMNNNLRNYEMNAENASCVLRAFLLLMEGKQETVFNIKTLLSFIKLRWKQKPRASEFVRIPESCRYCGQQRRTIKSFNRIFFSFRAFLKSKTKSRNLC